MNREELQRFIGDLIKLRDGISDDVALQVAHVFPTWSGDGQAYVLNQRVIYNDVLYKVLQTHTSQEGWAPTEAPSLFAKVLIPSDDEIYDWEQPGSTNPYMKGDKVRHNDKIWASIVDNNVWEPGIYGWEVI